MAGVFTDLNCIEGTLGVSLLRLSRGLTGKLCNRNRGSAWRRRDRAERFKRLARRPVFFVVVVDLFYHVLRVQRVKFGTSYDFHIG